MYFTHGMTFALFQKNEDDWWYCVFRDVTSVHFNRPESLAMLRKTKLHSHSSPIVQDRYRVDAKGLLYALLVFDGRNLSRKSRFFI